jgi:5-hydroxyisourate hydrolase
MTMTADSTDRRDFLVAGAALAAGALAAAPKPAAAQATGGRVTVHVLDLYSGTPANGIRIDLIALDGGAPKTLKSVVSNADGRPPEGPLLTPETIKPGRYQVVAYTGEYFKQIGAKVPGGYYTKLILEFDIYDPKQPHHVPFQITPWTQSASVLPG